MKISLITGISGQDGSYLAELLLSKNYKVFGLQSRRATPTTKNINHILNEITLIPGDMTDQPSLRAALEISQPDEIYNLAAQSFVKDSWTMPEMTSNVTGLGVLRILEAMKDVCPKARFYQACHCEKTRVVTLDGFKNFSDMKIGDEVITINETTRNVELCKIEKINEYDYESKMIYLKGRRIDQMITPNHRILFQNNENEIKSCLAINLSDNIRYSRVSEVSLPLPIWSQTTMPEIINFANFIDVKPSSNHVYRNIITNMPVSDFLYLLGIYIGDGYIKKDKEILISAIKSDFIKNKDKLGRFMKMPNNKKFKRTYEGALIEFAVPEKDKARKKLVYTLKKNNIFFEEKKMTVQLTSFTLARMFKMAGQYAENKFIPRFVFDKYFNHLDHIFDGLVDSDGHRRKTKISFREGLTTVSAKLAANFAFLCFALGKYCSFSEHIPSKHTVIKGRTLKKLQKVYRFSVAYKKTNKIYKHHITEKKYSGKVWCFEVEKNKNFLIERCGKLAFSGNSSSEQFGRVQESPQNERTRFYPRSPYAVAKLYGHWITVNYRESYNLHASCGILFNHDSKRRGQEFVTQKIATAAAKIKCNLQKKLVLGNLDAKRDIGHAKDYVYAMWLMLQQDFPDDYVISSGRTHSIKEMLEICFGYVGLKWESYIEQSAEFMRPAEVDILLGDSTKARTVLGWEPNYNFEQIMEEMVEYQLSVAYVL